MAGPYDNLPEPIHLEDTIAEVDTRALMDPQAGHDTERDFMLRYAIL